MNQKWQNTMEVFDDYIANLNKRIAGIEERKQIITENFNNWEKNK